MYMTHHFARPETMNRARFWLRELGIAPDHTETHAEGIPRLSVWGSPADVRKARLIIDVIESADPQGCPGVWDLARISHRGAPPAESSPPVQDAKGRGTSTIGWHPQVFDEILADPDVRAMCEAFGR